MNRLSLIFAVLLFNNMDHAQNIGIGTTTPAASAQLDVSSTTKGFLPPRMTSSQRNAIPGPVAGLVVFCTNCGTGVIQVYNGTTWTNMTGGAATTNNLAVGQFYQGGIIAYILQPSDPGYDASVPHGIIAAPGDQSSSAPWGCSGILIPGADGTALGTGNQNTIDILVGCATAGISARVCGDLVLNGYSDWYLPSQDELNKLFINHRLIGNFSPGPFAIYVCSSEVSLTDSWGQDFVDGFQGVVSKSTGVYVRAIRSF